MSKRMARISRAVFSLGMLLLMCARARAQQLPGTMTFDGVLCERKFAIADVNPPLAADWSGYTHLVIEMRTSTPQRFALWVYTTNGPRRIEIQPLGQNVWLRASIPLAYLKGMDSSGTDLASTNNRRASSFWMSVWGPFGDLSNVTSIGLAMQYPLNKPTVEIRSIHLAKTDEGSRFLTDAKVTTEFGQWALTDWATKIKTQDQLSQELADEMKSLGGFADFGYDQYGGLANTSAKGTGFFRVERIDGKWWFIDPAGHYFLSMGINGAISAPTTAPASVSGRSFPGGVAVSVPDPGIDTGAADRMTRLLAAWGMNTGGTGKPYTMQLRWPNTAMFLGLPDVYAGDFAAGIDRSANTQCSARASDPLLLGYFIGNEPPWGNRESEVVDLFLAGPDTATKAKLKDFLSQGDTPQRRKQFVVDAFAKYLNLITTAVKKYDPNHLILGIRFGGTVADAVLRTASVFDVCSINVYEYEPTKQVDRAYRITGRPILIGEFHLGVPENGLGAGLVQAANQTERGIGYRYYVEQAASLECFLGAHWFTWRDEPVLGRQDGENYNIGFVDATNRPYAPLVEAAQTTIKRLEDVHSGKILPFGQKPRASDAGTPSSPWDIGQ